MRCQKHCCGISGSNALLLFLRPPGYSGKNITINMQEKQFAFIPWWITTVLSRNNLKAEDLLSFERIHPYFSTEDLTSLVALSFTARFFAGNGCESDTTHLYDRWLATANSAHSKKIIADIATLASSEQTQDETLRRLVLEPSDGVLAYHSDDVKDTFEVALMGDSGIAVHLKAGFTLADHVKNSFNLLRCMVKKLYVYEDYHKLVSRPIGQAYIKSLMH